ncbi:unnamed protein product [Hymenolepis diminuta]|uniref:Uncharacterized protein n=1 Tax=Hymenolepis diminuta TaxID=6216 RepID=A0A0R3SX55_HYMDI|nr:unnamed protein product [Hymenolepis diminuta]
MWCVTVYIADSGIIVIGRLERNQVTLYATALQTRMSIAGGEGGGNGGGGGGGMSLNAVVRAFCASSSLDAFLHTKSAFTFDVADSCAIRGLPRRLIMPFISAITWKSRDVLNIFQFIATRGAHTPIRSSFFVALAADEIPLTHR